MPGRAAVSIASSDRKKATHVSPEHIIAGTSPHAA